MIAQRHLRRAHRADRPYKKAVPLAKALDILLRGDRQHIDSDP